MLRAWLPYPLKSILRDLRRGSLRSLYPQIIRRNRPSFFPFSPRTSLTERQTERQREPRKKWDRTRCTIEKFFYGMNFNGSFRSVRDAPSVPILSDSFRGREETSAIRSSYFACYSLCHKRQVTQADRLSLDVDWITRGVEKRGRKGWSIGINFARMFRVREG